MPLLLVAEIAGMRATVLNTQLDHLCTIQRRSSSSTDADGAPIYTWSTLLSLVPCHYWERSEEELVGIENATITSERLLLQGNQSVTSGDRVSTVVGYDSRVVAGPLNIREVIDQVNHTLLLLEAIR